MQDKRELILSRIFALMQGMPGIVSVWRDRGDLKPTDPETGAPVFPAAVLLDGRETQAKEASTMGHGMRPGTVPPTLMRLEPNICIVLPPRTNIQNVGMGEEISKWRVLVLKTILFDGVLQALTGSNGDIQYVEMLTDMERGLPMLGEIELGFCFTYAFKPDDLL